MSAAAFASDFPARTFAARWVTVPGAPQFEYGVHHFRRTFELPAKPSRFVVHVTADNRYQLFVNGERVAWGPARGDVFRWRYETVDIAPHLNAGRNVLAAVVWNFGPLAPLAQITEQTGFLLDGDTKAEQIVNTGPEWKCATNAAYSPTITPRLPGYYVAGPGDQVDAAAYPWGWELPGFDDSAWKSARPLTGFLRWELEPRSIPMMEEKPIRVQTVRRSSGVPIPPGFPARQAALQVPAGARAVILLDQNQLTTGYPEIVVSGGKGARITVRYAELLRLPNVTYKHGNRNEIEGKELVGNFDVFLPDGGARRLFRPLWWRTWRYIQLEIETASAPVTIDDLRATFAAYPFERKARFDSDAPELSAILDVGWLTARLCAHETYMDCPWWEQLQYSADTRLQGLISIYNSGDTRLLRNALVQLNDTRAGNRPTFSRAPSRLQQYIPSFSLWWIGMLRDYWMHVDDPDFVRSMMPGVHAILDWFRGYERSDGSLKVLPWWNQVDASLRARPEQEIHWAPIDLVHLLALQWAAELEENFGSRPLALDYRRDADRLSASIRKHYFDSGRRLFADTPERKLFTKSANSLAMLAGLVAPQDQRAFMTTVLDDSSLTMESQMYFSYYMHLAAAKAGLGDRYIGLLGPWRDSLNLGFTTFPEFLPENSRSDCHAWSAHPNINIFRVVLGIESIAPAYRRVRIQPSLGKLTRASGAVPHPNGEIAVSYRLEGDRLNAEISLPKDTPGEFVWRGQRRTLNPGVNRFVLLASGN